MKRRTILKALSLNIYRKYFSTKKNQINILTKSNISINVTLKQSSDWRLILKKEILKTIENSKEESWEGPCSVKQVQNLQLSQKRILAGRFSLKFQQKDITQSIRKE